jgi:hypothetical protein
MSIIERIAARKPAGRALNPRAIFALLLTAAALCGCARYDMTLTNGGTVTNVRRPKLDKEGGCWIYVTASGQKIKIPASRVVTIVPHGDKDQMLTNP